MHPAWVFLQYRSASCCEITAETLIYVSRLGVPSAQQCQLVLNHSRDTSLCVLPQCSLSTSVPVVVKSQPRHFYMCPASVFPQYSSASCCEITAETLLYVSRLSVPSVQQCQLLCIHSRDTSLSVPPQCSLSTAVPVGVKSHQRHFYMCPASVFPQYSSASCCEITAKTLLAKTAACPSSCREPWPLRPRLPGRPGPR